VSPTHCASPADPAVQAVQAWLMQSWLPPHSAELLQLPDTHEPLEQTWFAP
jgi:hypothetical protein